MTPEKESKASSLLQKNGLIQHKYCSIIKSQVIVVFRDATILCHGYAIYFKELYEDDSVTHSPSIHKHPFIYQCLLLSLLVGGLGVWVFLL